MEAPTTLKDWLGSEVLWWKWFGCLFWSIVFHIVCLLCLNSSILSPSYWFYDILIFGIQGALLLDTYDAFWFPLSGMRLGRSFLLHAFGGGGILWAYSAVFGRSDSFLTFSGAYFGVFIWYSTHFSPSAPHIFEFPWIQLPKKSQIRSRLPSIVRGSALDVASQIRFCLLLYVCGFQRPEEDWPSYLTSLAYLSLSASLLNTLLLSNLSAQRWILNVYLTEPSIEFPLPLLLAALGKDSSSPLLRHLASQDYALAMAQSPSRRASFFTLSQPGGHPHNWNSVRKLCQDAIGDFNDALLKITNPKKEEPPLEELIPSATSPLGSNLRMRRLGPLSTSTPIAAADKAAKETPQKTPSKTTFSKMLMDKISSLTAVPDAVRVREVFALHSQTLMWIVEGLSNLIAHSVKEDRYGVVQKDLASILGQLFNLQQVIERHKGMAVNARKKNKSEAKDSHIKNSLRNTVKKSLYVITIAFKDHISDIVGLSSDHQQKMRNFHAFME